MTLNPIQRFREHIVLHPTDDAKIIERKMGNLLGKMQPQDFSEMCEAFISGIEYEVNKYGICPAGIILNDKEDMPSNAGTCYSSNSNIIYISRDFIREVAEAKEMSNSKITPYIVSAKDYVFLAGIEEARHCYDAHTNPALMQQNDDIKKTLKDRGNARSYDDIFPAEASAKEEVHQVMVDTGIVHIAPILTKNVNEQEALWAAPYLKERAGISIEQPPIENPSVVIAASDAQKQPALATEQHYTIIINPSMR